MTRKQHEQLIRDHYETRGETCPKFKSMTDAQVRALSKKQEQLADEWCECRRLEFVHVLRDVDLILKQ